MPEDQSWQEPDPTRDAVLDKAKNIISGARRKEYGPPKQSFQRIADLWTALFRDRTEYAFTPADVAQALIMLKLSRLAETESHADSWIDICGYAALGAEVADIPVENV
jgi:hypothetical protein